MRQTIEVKQGIVENGIVVLKTAHTIKESLKAGERVLVDSDNLAFVYILEDEDAFIYVTLPNSVWPVLKQALLEDLSVKLTDGKTVIQLDELNEEMNYLIDNIKDNSNYGEEMERLVEELLS
ncbi:hypothetical protein [Bacillus solimangrovi]|uniref:Uncharacterized protein n=1 Tax=Bacillus solimangrovi TaxID=1305675 RepID=A0A1E5LC00_9BACI|nr:hypothetical protein [Bacillus solimangrovi]OEH91603.1 hypothetical protein BFG57_04320 [Bacillus solimangrovi]